MQTAFSNGFSLDEVQQLTQIDPWFLAQMQDLAKAGDNLDKLDLREAKKLGFSDRQIALARGTTEENIRKERQEQGIVPGYRLVDTCAAEFEAYTPTFIPPMETKMKPAKQAGKNPHPGRRPEPHWPGD
ncbi:hypothetical protein M5E88_11585 [Akkermansia muciniphila]|nr:hypothetical protein M5E88_11585 [Akkermansia muciniphila]